MVHRVFLACGLPLLLLAACSTSSTTTTPEAGPTNALKCGAGGITGTLKFADEATLASIAGATLTVTPGCNPVTTDDLGQVQVDLAPQLTKVHFSGAGYIPSHGEAVPVASGFYRTLYMISEAKRDALFPGWTKGSGYVVVVTYAATSDAGGCTTQEGLVVSVKGHPELTAVYLKDASTRDPTAKATNVNGLAVFGPVPPGTYEFESSKTGCVAGPDNGKYFTWPAVADVEADTLTEVQLKLP